MAGGFEQFSVDRTEEQRKQSLVDKKRAAAEINAEAKGSVLKHSKLPASVPLADRPVTPEQTKLFLGDDDSVASTAGKRAKKHTVSADREQLERDRLNAIKKYRAYYSGEYLQRYCEGIAPSDSWSLAVAQNHLDRARANANAHGTLDLSATAVAGALKGAEYVVHTMGINPLDLVLVAPNGMRISDAFMQAKDSPELQPELQQVGAELGLAMEANCYARFGYKMYQFMIGFSEHAKGQRVKITEHTKNPLTVAAEPI
jgi:hypothetical protein